MTFSEYVASLRNKRITVLGIGVSNTPLIRRLAAAGCTVTARDRADRERLGPVAEELENMGVRLILGENYLEGIEADVIFRTPGLRPDLPQISAAVAAGAELTSEMEAFFRVCPCRIIAVTGSDGKTTTTTIISELLKAAGYTVHLGGNIGQPLLCQADDMKKEDIAVLELSSFQLMTMRQSPEIAVVTNLAPNHLDVHKSMEEYCDAKRNIFRYQPADGKLVLNLDNEITSAMISQARCPVALFSRRQPVETGFYCSDGVIYAAEAGKAEPVLEASEIFLPGVHNIENFMAAFAAVSGLVDTETMRTVARTFKGVEHRIEHVRTLRGVRYYNDSIASSPSRAIAGLRSFDQKLIILAGGKDKGVPFDTLGEEYVRRAKAVFLTGPTAGAIRSAIERAPGYAGSPEIFEFADFRENVLAAARYAEDGDVVMLSPACTSFDRFRYFMERGKYFKEIINSLE